MTLRASGDRRVVARGQIRVDARRAMAKLREHLLVDLNLYAREIVRSAIAGGATAIDVHHDADDVTFTFDGEPVAQATLPRLLDHVIGDATTAEARRLRTLALGLNAALGLRPAFVDTIVADGGEPRQAIRMRWTPAMLEAGDEAGAEALPECERVTEPPGMPARGMRVHLKRRVGWNVLRRAVAGDLPPEISLLAEAVHDAEVVLTLSGRAFPHAPRPPALLRVPFRETGLRRAALEILPSGSGPPQIDFLEQGVLLIRKRYHSAPAFPDEAFASLELPVRVIADAPVLPTNASRSALREDVSLPSRISEAAAHALRDALSALHSLVLGQGEVPAGVEVLDRDPLKLEDALGNLICVVAGAVDRGAPVTDEARALLKIPLLRDAVGRPVAPLALLSRDRKEPLYVWTGKSALPEELGHWMRDVIWLRGRSADKLVALFHVADAAQILDQARAGLERRQALLAHPATDPVVPAAPNHLVREAFHFRAGPCAGLRGEVAIRRPSKRDPGAIFRCFVEGRHLQTIEVDASKVPLPLDAALAWEGHIRPTFRYDAIESDPCLRQALWYAVRVGILAVDSLAHRALKATDRDARLSELAPLIRAAAGARAVSSAGLGVDARTDLPLLTYISIWNAHVWPTTEPNHPTSLSEISLYAHRTGAICTAPPQTTGVAADGRPVLMLAPVELRWIQAIFPLAVTIPYAQALARPQDHEGRRRLALQMAIGKLRNCPVMAFTRPGVWGRIACSAEPRVTFLHAGQVLKAETAPVELGFMAIAADDTTLVPEPHFRGIRWQSPPDWLNEVGGEFLQRIVAAVEGDPAAWAQLTALDQDPAAGPSAAPILPAILDCPDGRLVRAHLIYASTTTADAALKARIEALPIVSVLDEQGEEKAASLSEVAVMHPAPNGIPVLRHVPGFETLDWRPVLVKDSTELTALERWSGSRTSLADEQISARREAARIERERREFLQKPVLDLHSVGELADPDATVMFYMIRDTAPDAPPPPDPNQDITPAAAMPHLKIALARTAGQLRDMCIAVALPRRGMEISCVLVDVLLDGRFLCQVSLPSLKLAVVARVGLATQEHVIPWHGLTPEGLLAVSAGVHEAAGALALELIGLQSGSSAPEPFYTDMRLLRLIHALLHEPAPPGSTGETGPLALRLFSDTVLWPTVQGEAHPWSKLKQPAYGRIRYPAWHRAKGRAEMDRPILYLPCSPEGLLLESILAQAGVPLRDESALLEKLQAARAVKAPAQSPRLSGNPPHPVLRTDLAAAGITSVVGEMEIVEGPASEVFLTGIDGIERPVKAELPIPLRVVARGEFLDLSEASIRPALLDIAKGARNHLVFHVAKHLNDLPVFVRDHLRHILVKSAGSRSKQMSKQSRHWEVIPDITGGYHCLAALQEDPGTEWFYTTDAPPYPKHDDGRSVLRLTEKEASALSNRLRLKDLTGPMRRRRQAEQRAGAPQIEAIVLTADQRAKCLHVVPLDSEGTTGEIGFLAPEHANSRGIIVHTTRRPLCQISEMSGWPILAIVNDDEIRPNQDFNSIRKIAQKEALKARVRTAADQALDEWLAPPPDALAVRRWHGIEWPETPLIAVAGTLFLPGAWPEEPGVRMHVHHVHKEAQFMPLWLNLQAPPLSVVVPVGGELLTRAISGSKEPGKRAAESPSNSVTKPGTHRQALADLALREAAILVAEALKETSSPLLHAYQWNLRLLGAREAGEPTAPTTEEGRYVNAGDILLELRTRGQIWFSRRAGDIEGKFPDKPPGFILLDDGASALLAVLRSRAPGALFELGGDSAEAEPLASAEPSGAKWPSRPRRVETEAAAPPVDDRALPATEPSVSWFSGLVRRVAEVVASLAPEPEPPVSAELCAVLLNAIDELRLTKRAVTSVEYTRSGRPIRFDRERSRLLLNRKHPAVQALTPRAHRDPRALTLLLCAAVGEINRGLDVVTDADERRALVDLLRAEPSLELRAEPSVEPSSG